VTFAVSYYQFVILKHKTVVKTELFICSFLFTNTPFVRKHSVQHPDLAISLTFC